MSVWGNSSDVIAAMRNWAELSGIATAGLNDDEIVGLVEHRYAGGVTQFGADAKVWALRFAVVEDDAPNHWRVQRRDDGRLLGWVIRCRDEWFAYAAPNRLRLGVFGNPADAAAEVWTWVSSQDGWAGR